MRDTTTTPPEGATPITSADVISGPTPERYEDVELWVMTSTTGLKETVIIRPEKGESGKIQQSPLDGSFLSIKFEFHGGEKNEKTGQQLFPFASLFNYAVAFHKLPIYKEGASPIDLELKRRENLKLMRIQERAAKLAEGLDDSDL